LSFQCLPGLVPVQRLGQKGLVKRHMSAGQVLNAPTYYSTWLKIMTLYQTLTFATSANPESS